MTGGGVPVGVVSPHLDDAVFSCGQLLLAHRGSVVVTVFSGGPAPVDPLPEWDELCGFSPGDDVMALRRREDEAALALAGATAARLGFWEVQYRRPVPGRTGRLWRRLERRLRPAGPSEARLVGAVASALAAVVGTGAPRRWFVPLGLVHPDHRVTAAAALQVARARPELEWHLYEELPYGLERPGEAAGARAALEAAGWHLRPAAPALDPDLGAKGSMAECYGSQVRYLSGRVARAVAGPETYHLLERDAGAGPAL